MAGTAAKTGSPALRGSPRLREPMMHGMMIDNSSPPLAGLGSRKHQGNQSVMQRLLAKRRWAFMWDSEKLELVRDEDAEEDRRDEGLSFSQEEVKEAVSTVTTSEDSQDLYEAASILREVTASGGEEGGRMLLRLCGIPALIRIMKMQDSALEEDAVMCFLNMLAHDRLKAILSDQGLVVPLVQTLKDAKLPSTRANIAACLSLITRSETQTWSLLTSGALTTLIDMLNVARKKREGDKESEQVKKTLGRVSSVKKLGKSGSMLFSASLAASGDASVHDACLALMHLARFHTIRKALIKHGIVPILVDVAVIAPLVDSEESVAALFQLLARVDGGPEAICIADEGAGAKALLQLAETGLETTQELALDALRTVATKQESCAQALRDNGVYEALATSTSFATEDLRRKASLTLGAMR